MFILSPYIYLDKDCFIYKNIVEGQVELRVTAKETNDGKILSDSKKAKFRTERQKAQEG